MYGVQHHLAIEPYADDKLRSAIGGVCVHWAWLEMTVERLRAYLRGAKYLRYSTDVGNSLTELMPVVARSKKLSDADKATFTQLVSEMPALKVKRHRVAHGLWGRDHGGNYQSLFPELKRRSGYSIGQPMSVEDIRQIKLEINAWHRRMRRMIAAGNEIAILPRPYRRRKNVAKKAARKGP